MNWLVWRLYRKQILFTGVAVALYAAVLVGVGNHAWHELNHALAAGKISSFNLPPLANTLPILSIAFPALLGMFWGAPLIAKEYAEGTHKFVWAQGVTRRKWLATKLAWLVGFSVLFAVTISAAVTWCVRAENALRFDKFTVLQFTIQGLAPVAYTVFAITLGACVGALLRTSVRSVGVTLALYVAIVFSVATFVRPHYMPPLSAPGGSDLHAAINMQEHKIMPGAGAIWEIGATYKTLSEDCTAVNGSRLCGSEQQTVKTVYQPANRYWIFQGIESGVYVAISVVLSMLAYLFIQKRDV